MNFNSLEFLIFLPVVLAVFWLLPHKFRWAWLLAASYYFYMSWNAWLIFLILGTTLCSYGAAIAIDRTKNVKIKKLLLALTIIVCLGTLVFFKYFNFLLKSAIDFLNLFSMNIQSVSLDIILPVGISFYTFQTLSYVIDVYRGKFAPEYHFGYYALFVSYFPQLVAGPIERPDKLLPQLRKEQFISSDDFAAGLRILLTGFFRKCVVADVCGLYVNSVFADIGAANSLAVAIAGALFLVQIYCDFAGYSEIATGAARMMGVRLTTNFDRPFLSVSVTEFFRRWHITLSKWFADYLYIPLGGSRKGKARKILNNFIVFGLCGLWHGANWTYFFWGIAMAVFISAENLFGKPLKEFLKRRGADIESPPIRLARQMLLFVALVPTALLFRSASLAEYGRLFIKLFSDFGFGADYFTAAFSALDMSPVGAAELLCALVCMAMVYNFGEFGKDGREELFPLSEQTAYSRGIFAQRYSVYVYIVLAIGACWLYLLSLGGVSEFTYFQF
ncbi:MAG TPA: MBOAT family protein [Clostridiales bacterium]|nr:MBOAT family protein [Clostridiales bacterium]